MPKCNVFWAALIPSPLPRTTHTRTHTLAHTHTNAIRALATIFGNWAQTIAHMRTMCTLRRRPTWAWAWAEPRPKLLLAKHFRDAQVQPNEFQMEANRAAKHKQKQQQRQRQEQRQKKGPSSRIKRQRCLTQPEERERDMAKKRTITVQNNRGRERTRWQWQWQPWPRLNDVCDIFPKMLPHLPLSSWEKNTQVRSVAPLRHTQSLNDDVDIFVFFFVFVILGSWIVLELGNRIRVTYESRRSSPSLTLFTLPRCVWLVACSN